MNQSFWRRLWEEVPWVSALAVLIVFACSDARSNLKPSTNNWIVRQQNIDEYSFERTKHESVPPYALYLFILFCSLGAAAVEGCLVTRDRIIAAVFMFVTVIEANMLNASFTAWGKFYVAEPRPDFRERCLGSNTAVATFDSEGNIICTTGDTSLINEGRVSFPSGHSSSSFCSGVLLTVYLMWTLFWRLPAWNPKWLQIREGLFLVCLIPMLIAFGITASRVVDHRHSPADVTAGAFIGTLFAVAYSSRFVRWASKRAVQLGKGEVVDNENEVRANVV